MKSAITSLLTFAAFSTFASNPQLVVEAVDNGGVVEGQTFRIHIELPSAAHSVHAIFGDSEDALSIQTTGSFFQHDFGNFSTVDINPVIVNAEPSLAFDSWVTLGADNASSNNLWTIGIDFDGFENGSGIQADNGAWFLIPTDARTKPESGSTVLLMQLTTTGIATGTMNVQGWDAEGLPWQARTLTFSTTEAQVFGCTDPTAENYNSQATYDNGSCIEGAGNEVVSVGELGNANGEQSILVFPNPVWEGQFNLQFSSSVELVNENLIVEVFDGAGKRVMAEEITAGAIIGGNRIIIDHNLASGTYTLSVRASKVNLATQIVIAR